MGQKEFYTETFLLAHLRCFQIRSESLHRTLNNWKNYRYQFLGG